MGLVVIPLEGHLTVAQTARNLCLHADTIRAWIREGKVDSVKSGRYYYLNNKVVAELAREAGISEYIIEDILGDDYEVPLAETVKPPEYKPVQWVSLGTINKCQKCKATLVRGSCLMCGWEIA